MVKCLNSLFCKECKVESDGLMSLLSIYSGFSRREMPATIPLCFICFLELSIKEYQDSGSKELDFRILVTAPWGPTIGDSHHKVPFRQVSETTARATLVSQYGDIAFMEFGKYEFEVFVNNALLHTAFLDITQVPGN